MLIYRIQSVRHPTDGAFGACAAAYYANDAAKALGRPSPLAHPCPYEDFKRNIDANEFCAFPSIAAYRRWFDHPQVRAALYARGDAHLVAYNVTRVTAQSELQCLFRMEDVISVRETLPDEYR